MKKRVLSLLSVLLVLCFALVGCGSKNSGSKLEGTTWSLSSGKDASGIEVTADQLKAFGEFTIEFKKDGVVTINAGGTSSDGTWKEKDDEITISADGDDITAKIEDGKMTMVQSDVTLIFEKK